LKLTCIDDLPPASEDLEITEDWALGSLYDKTFELEAEGAREPGVHASEVSSCLRHNYYTMLGLEPTDKPRIEDSKRFKIGHLVHAMVQRQYGLLNDEELSFEAEVPTADTPVGREWQITSRCDGVFTWRKCGQVIRRVGLEIKTCSADEWRRIKAPEKRHIIQAHIYMKCLDLPLLWFFYYNKSTQAVKPMASPWLIRFDKEVWQEIEPRIHSLLEYVISREEPPPEKGFHCMFCAQRSRCFRAEREDLHINDPLVYAPDGST